jgi:hypothetical protein
MGSLILIPLEDFPVAFLAFFYGVRLVVAFRLLARVFNVPALDPVEGPSMASLPGGRAKMGIVEIVISPSKPGMGEMKLSKSSIPTIKT